MKIKSRRALTLIEVIMAIVVVGMVSVSSWVAVSVLMKSAERGRNRAIAVNLIQKSQEEVKRIAQVKSMFENLQHCVFPPAVGNHCGLDNISAVTDNPGFTVFNGYSRTLNVSLEEGSTELKRALITVTWDEFNQVRQMQSVVLLSRPPEPLPGSMHGQVLDESNNLLEGVKVKVVPRDGSGERTQISQNNLDGIGANYNFANPSFILEPGAWVLSATHPDYYEYFHPADIIVDSNLSTPVSPFNMKRRPLPATIRIQLINGNSGLPIVFNNTSQIRLYESSSLVDRVDGGAGLIVSNIQFDEETTERFFTANTDDAFSSHYVGGFSCVGGLLYNGEGWSSAVVDQGGVASGCANPWNGNNASDRIRVQPGDELTVNVPLVDVPLATVQGYVRDNRGNPIRDAEIYVRYHDGSRYVYPYQDATDANGYYSVRVPAEQSFFPDNLGYYITMLAQGQVVVQRCCEQVGSITQNNIGGWQRVGPIREGDVVTKDFTLSANDYICGDVEGNVNNDLTSGAIFDASVIISGTRQTNGGGYYVFECAPSQNGFSIPRGNYRFRSRKTGYYENDTSGNTWYAPRGNVAILENQLVDYDARMWPWGSGTVTGTVVESGTGVPIRDAVVRFQVYDGTEVSVSTNTSGQFILNNIVESWPPPSLPAADPYYNHTVRQHSLTVNDVSGLYYNYFLSGFTLNNGQTKTVTIELNKRGGM